MLGENDYGELGTGNLSESAAPSPIGGLVGAADVETGGYSTCALLIDGGVQCWGHNNMGQLGDGTTTDSAVPATVAGLGAVKQISVGGVHACALLTSGGVQCWGEGIYGQLGDGNAANSSTPVTVTGLSGSVIQISAGYYHTCALLTNCSVQCWGDNGYGELGNGTSNSSATPVLVGGLSGVKQVSAGLDDTCAVLSDGTAKCWGDESSGKLGIGYVDNAGYTTIPVAVSGLTMAGQISAGYTHTCVVLTNGSAECWGDNNLGQTGAGSSGDFLAPAAVIGLAANVSQIAAKGHHSCALLIDGQVQCWGDNTYRNLGGAIYRSLTPIGGNGLAGVNQISTGADALHICALQTSGPSQCWGDNQDGVLGNGSSFNGFGGVLPGPISGLTSAVQISTSFNHTCALLQDGTAQCWGDNSSDELGNPENAGTYTSVTTPVVVSGLAGAKQIGVGDYFSCALMADASVQCWGFISNYNSMFVLNPTPITGLTGVTQIATGAGDICVLLTDGTVQCFGVDGGGTFGDGGSLHSSMPVAVSGLVGVTQISVGDHACARLADSTVQCWGLNTYGQLGNSSGSYYSATPLPVSGLTGVSQVTSGQGHTCALMTDATVQCWGLNDNGQLGNGTTTDSLTPVVVAGLSGVVQITASNRFTCALLATGTVQCWGVDTYDSLGVPGLGTSGKPIFVLSSALAPTSVVSRKTHGTIGTFDLPIDLTAALDSNTITVEPRGAEVGGVHRLIFTFSDPVTGVSGVQLAGTATSTLATGTAAIPVVNGNTVTVSLTGVPDRKRLQVTLTDINGVAGANATASLAYLLGDVTQDRQVTGLDGALAGAKSPSAVTSSNFQYNVTLSGSINALDKAVVSANSPKAAE